MQILKIKISDNKNMDFLIELLSKFTFVEEIQTATKQISFTEQNSDIAIRKPKGKPSVDDFAGIWENNPKTLDQIREKAWKRTT